MKLIKYLINKKMLLIYIAGALVISAVFGLMAWSVSGFLRLIPITFCLLLIMRACDDISDYEADSTHKTQYLSKRSLAIFTCVLSVCFVLLNLLFFGWLGLICTAAIAYILLMERAELLKIPLMALLVAYYFCMVCGGLGWIQISACACCLLISAAYFLYKRKVRK